MAGRDVSAPLPEAVGDPDVREMHADVVIVGSGAGMDRRVYKKRK
jgi:hypothetical protein